MNDHANGAQQIFIRPMQPEDLSDILQIQSACYTEVEPESCQSLLAKLRASPSTCFIASHRGEIIAYLIALPCRFNNPPSLNALSCEVPADPDCLYLHDVAVSPSARGAGVARSLVENFFRQLGELKLARATLIAVQGSVPYWRQFGFESVKLTGSLLAKIETYGIQVEYMQRSA